MLRNKLVILFLIVCTSAAFGRNPSSVTPVNLLCEYLTNPSGLDVQHPRFSWILQSRNDSEYGQRQTAYRIRVYSSPEKTEE